MHSHDNLCELLLVYRGLGSYIIRNRSFPIQEGDVLFYNQDESHEVCSASHEEIGTYCFAFVGLQFEDLPQNHIIPIDSQPVRASGIRFEFFRQLCEEAYQSMGTGLNGDAFAQCLSTAFLLSARDLAEFSYYNIFTVQGTAASRVFSRIIAKAVRMGVHWSDVILQGLTRPM